MRMNRKLLRCSRWLLLTTVLVLTGCRTMSEQVIEPPAVDVGYQAVVPKDASRYELGSSETVQMPELDEKEIPEFPSELISQGNRSVQILAQLVVNETGDVDRAIFQPSTAEDGLEPFRASIRKAVTSWKFSPLVIIRTVSDENGKVTRERTVKPVSLWYQFQFNVKNGQPITTMKGRHST